MKIAEVSEQFGLSVDTLRYYERVGLIPPVHRNESGIRNAWDIVTFLAVERAHAESRSEES